MKSKTKSLALLVLLSGIGIAVAFSSCKKDTDNAAMDQSQTAIEKYTVLSDNELAARLAVCTPGVIDQSEIDALTYVREEELLARDVYLYFKNLYTLPVFKNIANSEEAHTNAIKKLILKYNLTDPAANHQQGLFTNPDLQTLYDQLIAQGSTSLNDALYVGATIEDLDIFDLQDHITTDVDNADILMVLNNLLNGSKNHLRSFNKQLVIRGITYVPQYISQAEFDDIIQ